MATGQNEELLTLLLETDDLCHDWYSNNAADSGDDTAAINKEKDPMHSKCVNQKNDTGLSPLIVACEQNLPSQSYY